MLFGVPTEVKRFVEPVVKNSSKPIRAALAPMILAFLLAPHYRRLKTIAGFVLGHRRHVSTISRRLVNPKWTTWRWYAGLFARLHSEVNQWERKTTKGKRQWMIVIDSTFHGTVSRCMENLVTMSKRKDPRRRNTRQHIFVMGMILTDRGARLPLPRRSYYTKEYCRLKGKKYRTQNDLAAILLREAMIPPDVEVTVVFDSAFDADQIHRVCRRRGFREVFPVDPNRNLAASDEVDAMAIPLRRVVAWTRTWSREEFTPLELQVENESHAYFRRRHVDNLRVKKTRRHYVISARRAAVSKLGACLIVASYKENPKVELLDGQSGDWWECHTQPIPHRRKSRNVPRRWHGKVLACTDPSVTARQVIEWYEVRWQVELLFRELKTRMQFNCYVLMKFEAVERYLDFLLMGFLLLEHQRLKDMKSQGAPSTIGEARVHARVTDRLRSLESQIAEWNIDYIEKACKTKAGRTRLIAQLRNAPCHVA